MFRSAAIANTQQVTGGAQLAAAHSMELTAVETFESPSRPGFPLAYGSKLSRGTRSVSLTPNGVARGS
jgi:hypothetical protein